SDRVPARSRRVAGDAGIGLVIAGGDVVEVGAVVRPGGERVEGRVDQAEAMSGDLVRYRDQPGPLRTRRGRPANDIPAGAARVTWRAVQATLREPGSGVVDQHPGA